MVSAARPPIELVLDVPGGQTYPRDSVPALGGMSTSSSTRQPESSVSAARPPIELALDVPGGQTYPRDSVPALGGLSTSSSTHTLSGAQHLRRGQVVAAATAPFLAFGDLQPGDAAQMHFVRAVSDAQAAGADPQIGQRGIRGQSHGAEHLHGPVHHAIEHARHYGLDHGNFLARPLGTDVI